MSTLLIVQTLNGLQFGLMLFLVAAGLTLVFGVMDFINLAHGVQYMLGAYLMALFAGLTGSFGLGLLLALPTALASASTPSMPPASAFPSRLRKTNSSTLKTSPNWPKTRRSSPSWPSAWHL
jgi:branched-subunit amino acid ABC-type transport system permease component